MTQPLGYGAWQQPMKSSRVSVSLVAKGIRTTCSVLYVQYTFVKLYIVTNGTTQAFHNNGRYVLSAGHDQVINLVSS